MAKRKKRKMFFRIFLLLILLGLIVWGIIEALFLIKIKNIFIINNNILSDQYIIELAEIGDYPSSLKNLSFVIEKRIKQDKYILDVNVKKKGLSKVYIEVTENRPLFYSEYSKETVLIEGTSNDIFNVPTLINYVPDSIYDKFIECLTNLDYSILIKISEIKYDPNTVDDERFLLIMNDGNYVYINLNRFSVLNKYLILSESVELKNGTFYLDYGNTFVPFN